MSGQLPGELPAVAALRTLSIFGADQGGAYREHFAQVAEALGNDIPTRLSTYASQWAEEGSAGVLILTGNAGTGKTAVAQAYAEAAGGRLPHADEVAEIAPDRFVIKDLSGLPDRERRAAAVELAIAGAGSSQAVICANEGVLRDVTEDLGQRAGPLRALLEDALRNGAAERDHMTVVNVNRQRPTSDAIWDALMDFVAREDLWEPGCAGCPGDGAGATGCPFRANAAALREPDPREAMRELVRFGAGAAVPTFREVLAILAWAIVGGQSCDRVKRDTVDRGAHAHTAEGAYFHRAIGGGLRPEVIERSPLLRGMRSAGLGELSDLQVDEWLRDSQSAPQAVQALAGAPDESSSTSGLLAGSRSPHDRVGTGVGCMTFHSLGETLSTSEDLVQVEECLKALVGADGEAPRQSLWRQRLYFEAPAALGGRRVATARLLDVGYLGDFTLLAQTVADDGDAIGALAELVEGLNFLVCGFSSSADGLIVPDQAGLFARDPGSFRPARPSLIHSQVSLEQLRLKAPDEMLVRKLVDVDHIDIELEALGNSSLALRIRPRMYQAIREAQAFQGPVGQGIAEMTDLRGFYGRLASELPPERGLRVADPLASPPSLQTLRLPHFG